MCCAVPMVGFGFMDNLVMIQAGEMIDCTLGVKFGLSTLTAAAYGQVLSDLSGTLFGSTMDAIAAKLGLQSAKLTHAQERLSCRPHASELGEMIYSDATASMCHAPDQ